MYDVLIDRFDEAMYQITGFLPRLAAALGILMVGLAIAKMVERGTDLALHRIGFDRWMQEGGVTEALERAGTTLDPSSVVAKLVFWVMMLLVILLAASALGIAAVGVLFGEMIAYIPSVITAVIVLVIGTLLGEFVKYLVLASAGALPGAVNLARAAKAAVILLAVFMALEQLNIAQDIVLVFFMAVVGAVALAAALAFGLGGREVAGEMLRGWYDRARASAQRRADWERAHQHRTTPAPPRSPGAPPGGGVSEDPVAPSRDETR